MPERAPIAMAPGGRRARTARANRKSAAKRGYDRKHRKARERYLREHPLCERCELESKVSPSIILHHRDGDPTNRDPANFEALCRDCHEIEHGRKREEKR